jgi:predicted ATPase
MLQIRLLGQFAVLLDGEPIEISSRPAQSLFAYLLLQGDKAVRREKAAGMLWPDSTDTNARNNLRQAIWRIRRALDENKELIQSDSFSIWLDPDATYSLDIHVLEQKVDTNTETSTLQETVVVYEGEFLPGFYDDWILAERQRLEHVYTQKLGFCLERMLAEGRWHDVLDLSESAISLRRSVEPAYRALMTANAQLGDLSAVSDAYQRCLQSLESEGLEPSSETRSLYQDLLQDKLPSFVPSEPTSAFPEQEIDAPQEVFVAREGELAQLTSSLELAIAGEGRFAFIAGVAGSGKSALMRQFGRLVHETHPDLLVAFGHCNALTGFSDPFHPFRQVLSQLIGDYKEKHADGSLSISQARTLWKQMGDSIHAIIDHAPGLLDTLIPSSRVLAQAELSGALNQDALRQLRIHAQGRTLRGIDPEQRQANLYEALGQTLTRVSERAPLLIVIDDLQWIDIHSASLLFHLARQFSSQRIMVLGAYRSDEVLLTLAGEDHPLQHILAEIKRMYGNVEIALSGENASQSRTFVEAFLDTEPNRFDEQFREALFQHTAGNPLFTIELLREMELREAISKDPENHWVLEPEMDWERLPPRIEGVIEERLERLDEELYEILKVASIQGDVFEAEVCAGVINQRSREVVDRLSQELDKRHRLVVAKGTSRIDGRRISKYGFRHILFQKYLYSMLDDAQQEYLHEAVGLQLETLYGDKSSAIAGRLAEHFYRANVAGKAVDYCLEAGEHARYASVNEEAVQLFTKGLDIVNSIPAVSERQSKELALQVSLGVALTAVKGYGDPDVEQAYGRARKLCQSVDGSPSLFPTLYGLRTFYVTRAKHKTALELGELLLELATVAEDPALLIEAHLAVGSSYFYMGQLNRARQHLELALELYHPDTHSDLRFLYGQDPAVACESYLAVTNWCLGYQRQSGNHAERAMKLAERLDHPLTSALAHVLAAVLESADRDVEGVSRHADQAIAISERHGFPFWMTAGQVLKGWSLVVQGEPEQGMTQMQGALDSWINLGAELGRVHYLSLVAEALGEAGMLELAMRLIAEAEESMSHTGELIAEAEVYRIKAGLLGLHGDDPNQIERTFLEAIEIARRQHTKSFELRSAVALSRHWIESGQDRSARKLLRQITRGMPEGFSSPELKQAHMMLRDL